MEAPSPSWREALGTALSVFAIAFVGCMAAFALWLQDLDAPQVALLGSGNRLSLLVTEGPARLILATGDDPIAFENALTRVRPLFARRVDVLLVAGDASANSLLVPLAARGDRHVRVAAALAPLPRSPERDALGAIASFDAPRRIQLGPTVSVTVETALPVGADPEETFPAWRAIVERGETRIVVLSDGTAAALFPPHTPASVLAVAGDDPAAGWELDPAAVLVANADAISGPELRAAFERTPRPPQWGYRVFAGEALRMRFIPGGIELPADSAQPLSSTPTESPMPTPDSR